jgi:hypothetical protein
VPVPRFVGAEVAIAVKTGNSIRAEVLIKL